MSQDAFENLLFGCPLLEKLIFDEFDGFTKINIHAPSLKSLGISGKFEDISFINTTKGQILNLMLKTARYCLSSHE